MGVEGRLNGPTNTSARTDARSNYVSKYKGSPREAEAPRDAERGYHTVEPPEFKRYVHERTQPR